MFQVCPEYRAGKGVYASLAVLEVVSMCVKFLSSVSLGCLNCVFML